MDKRYPDHSELLRILQVYGDHRFKCAVSSQLRVGEPITNKCDCGWQVIARELMTEKS